jgi:hypothetical protein
MGDMNQLPPTRTGDAPTGPNVFVFAADGRIVRNSTFVDGA